MNKKVKVAYLFPGQGAQYVGMGKDLYDNFTSARRLYEEADDLLGFSLSKMCFEGSMEELTKTYNAQPALLVTSIAAYQVLEKNVDCFPSCGAGHSLGEFSALTSSGVLSFQDAVKLVRKRGEYMDKTCHDVTGPMMMVVRYMNVAEVQKYCDDLNTQRLRVEIACDNTAEQVVVSGECDAIEELQKMLEHTKALTKALKVSGAFHSFIMEDAVTHFREEVAKYQFHEGKWPVISNVTAKFHNTPEDTIENIVKQLTHTVRWRESVHFLEEQGVRYAIEIGAKNTLKQMMKKSRSVITADSFEWKEDIETIRQNLSNASEKERKRLVRECITRAFTCKNYTEKLYEKQDLEELYRMKKLYEEKTDDKVGFSDEDVDKAIHMLTTILDLKQVPEIQKKRLLNLQ